MILARLLPLGRALHLQPVSLPIIIPSLASFARRSMADHQQQQEALSAERIVQVLRAKFTDAEGSVVAVEDTSGDCGAMFHVRVQSPQFNGMTRVQQQKMVNGVLREQIKQMHGITMDTKPAGS